jgi:hypothetical protein
MIFIGKLPYCYHGDSIFDVEKKPLLRIKLYAHIANRIPAQHSVQLDHQ